MRDTDITDKARSLEPLTDERLRQLWISAPYPEVKQLLWEIRRLQEQLVAAHRLLLSAASGYDTRPAEDAVLILATEPCIQRHVSVQMHHASVVRGDKQDPPTTIDDQRKWLKAEISAADARRRAASWPSQSD